MVIKKSKKKRIKSKKKSIKNKLSSGVKNLLKIQIKKFGDIYKELSTNPKTYKKKTHWSWYVFPTKKIGYSDPYKTCILNINDVNYILNNYRTRVLWIKILDKLSKIFVIQKNINSIPMIDHNRINFFLVEWTSPIYKKIIKKFPKFEKSLKLFNKNWNYYFQKL